MAALGKSHFCQMISAQRDPKDDRTTDASWYFYLLISWSWGRVDGGKTISVSDFIKLKYNQLNDVTKNSLKTSFVVNASY